MIKFIIFYLNLVPQVRVHVSIENSRRKRSVNHDNNKCRVMARHVEMMTTIGMEVFNVLLS
jgi:hypothetical protein